MTAWKEHHMTQHAPAGETNPTQQRTPITVLTTQLEALRELWGPELSDDDLYSAAAIAVLLRAVGVAVNPETGRPAARMVRDGD
jgi:hypothetical protein